VFHLTSTTTDLRGAALDSAHVGDIRGALGTISLDDLAPRRSMSAKMKTLLAIVARITARICSGRSCC
jgi:hypothetical protein